MFKKLLIVLGGFVALVTLLGAVKGLQIAEMSKQDHSQPLPSVATIAAQSVQWPQALRAIGTLAPVQGVTLSADADGAVVKITADSGSRVEAGALLVELDTTVEKAQWEAAKSRAELARINLTRAEDLWKRQAISQSDYDASSAAARQTMAEVASLEAVIAKKQIRAPFAGRVGIRLVNLGQYVGRGAPLFPLQQLDPVYVNFTLPQRQLGDLALGQSVNVMLDAFATPFTGTITAINSQVDAATRTIAVQATVPNPDERLRAGMFARVEVNLPSGEPQVAVPATAIAYASYGNSVFVVEKMTGQDGKEYLGVRQQFVTLGQTRGDLVAVSGGLKAGEEIVAAGVFKLRHGAPVQVNNTVLPSANPTPEPKNT